jgi:putative transposase
MRTYTRALLPGATYFFTLAVADRNAGPLLDNIGALRNAFRTVRRAHPFAIDAIVVLPDHLHCLWTLPEGDSDYPTRWRLIKAAFSRAMPPGEPVSDSRARRGERAVWQRRYWEHVIRDERDFERHVDYIHYNPVKHGWSEAPGRWPYSSFRKFVAAGVYDATWAADEKVRALELE